MTTQYANPTEESASLTAQLDALTAEYKAAVEQANTPPGDKTGIEKLPGLLASAQQLVQRRDAIREQPVIIKQYVGAVEALAAARADYPPFVALIPRIRSLLAEAEAAERGAEKRIRDAASREQSTRRRAQEQGVDAAWIEAEHEKVR